MKNRSHFVLDNTLWLLYRTIKLRWGTIIAIRFKHRGQQYEADTPDEAIRMREMLEKYDQEEVKHGNITEEELIYEKTQWSEDRFLSMTQNIGVAQQKFLAVLRDSPRGPVNVESIAKKLGVNSAR